MFKKISKEQLDKMANYLATRPYVEVFQLINMIGALPDCACEKVEEAAEETTE